MAHIHAAQLNNTTYLIEPILYATAGGTSLALTAAINNFELTNGVQISIKVSSVSANATLNVNNTGAKSIYHNGAAIKDNMLISDKIYNFVYDGTNWVVIGHIPYVNNHNLTLS